MSSADVGLCAAEFADAALVELVLRLSIELHEKSGADAETVKLMRSAVGRFGTRLTRGRQAPDRGLACAAEGMAEGLQTIRDHADFMAARLGVTLPD